MISELEISCRQIRNGALYKGKMISGDSDHDAAGFENGSRVPISEGDGGDEMIARCAARCTPPITIDQALQALQFYDEHLANNDSMLHGSLAQVIKDSNAYFEKVFALLIQYQSNQSSEKMIKMSTRVVALAHGWKDVAGAESPTDLAKKMDLKKMFGQSGKQTVNKCFHKFLKLLRLSRFTSQRTEESVSNMRAARMKQVSKTDGRRR